MMPATKRRGRLYDPRVQIPPYLTDSNYAAPCYCGDPFDEDDPALLVTGETGLNRFVHFRCVPPGMLMDDDDD